MLAGFATPESTAAFAARQVRTLGLASGNFRATRGLTLGTVGLGTYLGEPDESFDARYETTVAEFVRRGGNVLDTAVNYRAQRSERSIGRALERLTSEGEAKREEIVVCTKGGYFSFDGRYPKNRKEATEWVEKRFFATGILRPEEVAQGCHALAPAYLRHEVETSRKNLGLETIDVYYLHNPETQLGEVKRDVFRNRIKAAFETLEELAVAGAIRYYGLATWSGFRAAPTADDYLSLEDLVGVARELAGDGHRMRFLQAPFNLAMLEAARFANQRVGSRLVPLFEAAQRLDVACVASATILQGKLAKGLPTDIAELFPGFATDAQRAIQFNRSVDQIAVTLVGMSSPEHVIENLAIAKRPPAPAETAKKLLLKLA